jgi:hypothetical protein
MIALKPFGCLADDKLNENRNMNEYIYGDFIDMMAVFSIIKGINSCIIKC